MSDVAAVILTCSHDEFAAVVTVNERLNAAGYGRLVELSERAGGRGEPPCAIWIGAFTGLDVDDLVQWINGAKWKSPSAVTLHAMTAARGELREVLPILGRSKSREPTPLRGYTLRGPVPVVLP